MTYSDNFIHPNWEGNVTPDQKLDDAVLFLMETAYDNVGALRKDETGKNFELDDDYEMYCEYILDVVADAVDEPVYYPCFKNGKRNNSNWIRPEHTSEQLEEFFFAHSDNFIDREDDYPEEYWDNYPEEYRDDYPEEYWTERFPNGYWSDEGDPHDMYEKRNVKFAKPMPADIFVGSVK